MGTTSTSQLWISLANLLGIPLHQTTSYNPAVNGMVEYFHCALKPALMSHYKDYNWFTQLPWVLFGLRTTPKDTLYVSAAETVYGPLDPSAGFFPSATSSDNLQHQRHVVGRFISCCQTYKPPAKQHMATDLHKPSHVFLRNDTIKSLRMLPFVGPFPCDLIRRTTKGFVLKIRGRED
ncbi:uncharacterized protein [Palaemon carinicauda]|uniref:uncharacterized protein n=1 Tax=Palaemon carinicauda TaxID=392227 RepID=UPI0035B5D79C